MRGCCPFNEYLEYLCTDNQPSPMLTDCVVDNRVVDKVGVDKVGEETPLQ